MGCLHAPGSLLLIWIGRERESIRRILGAVICIVLSTSGYAFFLFASPFSLLLPGHGGLGFGPLYHVPSSEVESRGRICPMRAVGSPLGNGELGDRYRLRQGGVDKGAAKRGSPV
jgi:hypothetical protein